MQKLNKKVRFLVCPDSFKESLSAGKAADIMGDEIQRCFPTGKVEVHLLPLADGGEGTAELLTRYMLGETYNCTVVGPLKEQEKTWFGYNQETKTAFLEMSRAAGLELVPPDKRNPLYTTTYGVGEMIRKAIELGARTIYLGLGGSATVDCGTGMAEALGVCFFDADKRRVDASKGGAVLNDIHSIDMNNILPQIRKTEIICLSDVNTLLQDCVKIFAPQKGADSPEKKQCLCKGVENFYFRAREHSGPKDFKGAGAAGGLGYGCRFFLNSTVRPGARVLLDLLNFKSRAESTDYIITGEGSFDAQSFEGKTIGSLLYYLKEHGIKLPLIILCGQVKDISFIQQKQKEYPCTVFSVVNETVSREEHLLRTEQNLRFQLSNLMHFIQNKVE